MEPQEEEEIAMMMMMTIQTVHLWHVVCMCICTHIIYFIPFMLDIYVYILQILTRGNKTKQVLNVEGSEVQQSEVK